MSAQTQQLLQVQALDTEIGRLTRQIDQLTAAIGDQLKVKAGDLAIRQAEEALRKAQSAQRDREHELATLEARIKDHEARLYSGKGSPRDLQALQRDIEHDRERRAQIEEQALKAMDVTERSRAEVDRVRKAVARVLSEAAAGKEKQTAEREQLQAQLAKRREQRAALAGGFPAPVMQLYERLRQRMADGVAVAEVSQQRCSSCHDTLPSADVQRARRAETPVQCPTCQRLLHVP